MVYNKNCKTAFTKKPDKWILGYNLQILIPHIILPVNAFICNYLEIKIRRWLNHKN